MLYVHYLVWAAWAAFCVRDVVGGWKVGCFWTSLVRMYGYLAAGFGLYRLDFPMTILALVGMSVLEWRAVHAWDGAEYGESIPFWIRVGSAAIVSCAIYVSFFLSASPIGR